MTQPAADAPNSTAGIVSTGITARDALAAYQASKAAARGQAAVDQLDAEILQALAGLDAALAVRLADAARHEGMSARDAVRQALGDWIYNH